MPYAEREARASVLSPRHLRTLQVCDVDVDDGVWCVVRRGVVVAVRFERGVCPHLVAGQELLILGYQVRRHLAQQTPFATMEGSFGSLSGSWSTGFAGTQLVFVDDSRVAYVSGSNVKLITFDSADETVSKASVAHTPKLLVSCVVARPLRGNWSVGRDRANKPCTEYPDGCPGEYSALLCPPRSSGGSG